MNKKIVIGKPIFVVGIWWGFDKLALTLETFFKSPAMPWGTLIALLTLDATLLLQRTVYVYVIFGD